MTDELSQNELSPRERGRVLACEAVLYSEFGRRSDVITNRVIAVLRAESDPTDAGIRSRRVQGKLILALAASLLLAVGLWFWNAERARQPSRNVGSGQGTRSSEVVARAQAAEGRVMGHESWVTGEKESAPLKMGDEVRAGTRIETGEDGAVRLEWVNQQTTLELSANASLDTRHSTLVVLDAGRLSATVAKQAPGKPFVVETPNTRMTVLGTRFTVTVSGNADVVADSLAIPTTRLEVQEGAVRLTRKADGASVEVSGGHVATVSGTAGELKPVPLERAGVVFEHDFQAISEGEWSKGKLVRQVSGRDVTAIASVPCKGSPTFDPDQRIELTASASSRVPDRALFVLPGQVEIRIRIRSEKPGEFGISHHPVHPSRSFPEHFYSGGHPVGPQWQEVVLHAEDLKPYRREGYTRDLKPGLGITGFVINGFGAGRVYVDRYEVRGLPVRRGGPKRGEDAD